jgi:pimeloyl-ACP methyl ester carboxylesterase
LGTDARLYALQQTAFPQLIVPTWITPRWNETLPQYAERFASELHVDGPCFIGGVSFGGMIALEMTKHLPARACFLISTIRSARELPFWMRILGPGAWLLPPFTDRVLSLMGTALLKTVGPVLPASAKGVCTHLSKTRSPILPWACRNVVKWRPDPNGWPCPVFHLHGDRDVVLPHRGTTPTQIVPKAGHLLPLTHPFVVNEFLRRGMQQVTEGAVGNG